MQKKQRPCAICKKIPDKMEVEILHTPERLPKEVDKLEIIGGISCDYALGQVRKCPSCSTYYLYFHDHDSESGVGYGYTDEGIERISDGRAREVLRKNVRTLTSFIDGIQENLDAGNVAQVIVESTTKRMEKYKEDRARLEKELEQLN